MYQNYKKNQTQTTVQKLILNKQHVKIYVSSPTIFGVCAPEQLDAHRLICNVAQNHILHKIDTLGL